MTAGNLMGVVSALIVLAAMIMQAWFYHRILRKVGRSAWWNLSTYLPILLGIGLAIAIPSMGGNPTMGIWGVIVAIVFVPFAIWPFVAIWLLSFVEWPAIPAMGRNLSWKKLAGDNGQESNHYFELAAIELTSGTVDPACWGRALALSASESTAKTKYVQLRVVALALAEKGQTASTFAARNSEKNISRDTENHAVLLSIGSSIAMVLLFLAIKATNESPSDDFAAKSSVGGGKQSEPGIRGSPSPEGGATPQAKSTAPEKTAVVDGKQSESGIVKFCHAQNVSAGEECWGGLTLANGNKYVGMFKDGKFNGDGGIYEPDGSILRYGLWENGVEGNYDLVSFDCEGSYKLKGFPRCRARLTLPNGNKYIGIFTDGKVDGNGIMTFPNGSQYFGEFKNGKFNGKGLIFSRDGSVLQSGFWENGVMVGGQ